jgi:hypothetical protein
MLKDNPRGLSLARFYLSLTYHVLKAETESRECKKRYNYNCVPKSLLLTL